MHLRVFPSKTWGSWVIYLPTTICQSAKREHWGRVPGVCSRTLGTSTGASMGMVGLGRTWWGTNRICYRDLVSVVHHHLQCLVQTLNKYLLNECMRTTIFKSITTWSTASVMKTPTCKLYTQHKNHNILQAYLLPSWIIYDPPMESHGRQYLKVSNTQNPAFWAGVWNKDAGSDVRCRVSLDAVRNELHDLGWVTSLPHRLCFLLHEDRGWEVASKDRLSPSSL